MGSPQASTTAPSQELIALEKDQSKQNSGIGMELRESSLEAIKRYTKQSLARNRRRRGIYQKPENNIQVHIDSSNSIFLEPFLAWPQAKWYWLILYRRESVLL